GVARVGNAPGPDDYYIGPEAPGILSRPEGGYKDNEGRIKRQAARFRVYGLNSDGRVIREITADVGQVEWRVHIANRKAGWYQFLNAMDLGPHALPARRRNEAVRGADRAQLVIDPGSRRISGTCAGGAPGHAFDTGQFF